MKSLMTLTVLQMMKKRINFTNGLKKQNLLQQKM